MSADTPIRSETSATGGPSGLVTVRVADLPGDASARDLLGADHGGIPVSLIVIDHAPGDGPGMHVHEYAEVIVVLEGEMTLTDGRTTAVVSAGEIAIAPANCPHSFTNTGSGRLRSIDIHTHQTFITRWLPDPD